jgi:PIN domain nuclease of toxin-antitoxin system
VKIDTDGTPDVLDASAVLAYLRREPGSADVRRALAWGAIISTVNLAEVHGRVASEGRSISWTSSRLAMVGLRVEPFLAEDAEVAGSLLTSTRELGLSLADRACLALALRLGLPVLTTDRDLARTDVGVEVKVIR